MSPQSKLTWALIMTSHLYTHKDIRDATHAEASVGICKPRREGQENATLLIPLNSEGKGLGLRYPLVTLCFGSPGI